MSNAYALKRIDRLLRPRGTGIERFIHAVTYRCNSRCAMCNIWREPASSQARSGELSVEDLERIFDDRRLFAHVEDIGLSGGEPVLRSDLARIARFYLVRFPRSHLSINTNGVLPERTAGTLAEIADAVDDRSRLRVSFSMDGLAEQHDHIRGVHGNFEKVLASVAAVRAAAPSVPLGFTMTILPDNHGQILSVWKLAREHGVELSFSFAQVSGAFYRNEDKCFGFTPPMLDEIGRQIDSIRRSEPSFRNFYYDRMVDYQRNKRQVVPCHAGRNSFFMDPTGTIYPCILLDMPFGNVANRSFRKVWEGSEARSVRNAIRRKRCHCWGCESEVSFRRSWKVAFHGLAQRLGKGRA